MSAGPCWPGTRRHGAVCSTSAAWLAREHIAALPKGSSPLTQGLSGSQLVMRNRDQRGRKPDDVIFQRELSKLWSYGTKEDDNRKARRDDQRRAQDYGHQGGRQSLRGESHHAA